jgi:uncharacterized protein YjdB
MDKNGNVKVIRKLYSSADEYPLIEFKLTDHPELGTYSLYFYVEKSDDGQTEIVEPEEETEKDVIPATKLEIATVRFNGAPSNNNNMLTFNYEDGVTPFVYSTGSISGSMEVYVRPTYTTDDLTVEVTEGSDILTASAPNANSTTASSSYRLYGVTLNQKSGQYGKVTVQVTAGDLSESYTFEIKKAENNAQNISGVWFDSGVAQNATTNLVVGNSYQYVARPDPWYTADSANPYMWYDVEYELSDTSVADLSVATVEKAASDSSGNEYTAKVATVTPKKAGQVTLIAYPAGIRGWYKTITLTVTDPDNLGTYPDPEPDPEPATPSVRPDESGDPNVIWATSVSLPTQTTIAVGKTYTMNPLIQPANCNDELSFYSYNKNIASVNADTGVVTGVAAGETTIGVTTSSGMNAEMKIVVVDSEIPTESVTIPTSFEMIEGDVKALSFTRTPENATDDVTWVSDDESIVKVVGGNLTAIAMGETTITVTSGSVTQTCKVTVYKSATSILLSTNSAQMKRGETLQLTATLLPEDSAGDVTWSTSNKAIATVSSTGKVTAVGYGSVEITATVNKVSSTCNVFVSPNLDFEILGASVRVSDPYGIRFGIQLGKTGDYNNVKIVEYGTIMLPTDKLAGNELTLSTSQVLKVKGEIIYSETSKARVYTGVLINIPQSSFGTDVSGRGYLIYEDTNGVQHTIYTDTVSRSFTGVAQAAYDSYSKITNPTTEQAAILKKLKTILGK